MKALAFLAIVPWLLLPLAGLAVVLIGAAALFPGLLVLLFALLVWQRHWLRSDQE